MLPIVAPGSTTHDAAFSHVYPDPQNHAFSQPLCNQMSLETPTGEVANASAPEQPLSLSTGHSSKSAMKSFEGSTEVCGHPMALSFLTLDPT